MRKNLTFCERLLVAFACVVKTVAPTMAVKYFTIWFPEGRGYCKEGAKERAKLFLPGAEKELKAIKEQKLSESQIQRRVWSRETELELLKQGNYALIGNVKSGNTAALDIICASDDPQLIAKVFSQATPSVEYLKNWLKKTTELVVVGVIKKAPTVFNDLHYEDVEKINYLGALVNCALEPDSSKQTKNVARKWAEEVITRDEYMRCLFMSEAEKVALFESAVDVLIGADYNFTRYLEALERWHKPCYSAIRDRAGYSSYVEDYIIDVLPRVWFMAETKGVRTFARNYGDKLTDKQDAASWMALLKKFIDRPRVAIAALHTCTYLTYGNPDVVVVNLQKALVEGISTFHVAEVALSKLPEQYRWQIQAKLYEAITTAGEAKKAMKLLPKSYRKGLRLKLVEKAVLSDVNLLLSYWPFAGWEEETAEKAVRKLAGFKALPMTKLSDLPESLQKAGIEELETLSEISAINRRDCGDDKKILMEQKLHSRAEAYLFQMDYNWQELKSLYIANNEMEEASFRMLVNFRGTGYSGDEKRIKALIALHAKTWRLTEREYEDLLQSPYYSALATELKQYSNSKKYLVVKTEPETKVEGVGQV